VKESGEDSATRKAEIENFHGVLMDISMGVPSERVKEFLVQSYVRGAMNCRTADKAELEGSTSVFTKRRQLGIIRGVLLNMSFHMSTSTPNHCSLLCTLI